MIRFPKKEFFESVLAEVEEIERQNPGCTRTFVVKELRKKPFSSGKERSRRTCEDYVKWVWLYRVRQATVEDHTEETTTGPIPGLELCDEVNFTKAALLSLEKVVRDLEADISHVKGPWQSRRANIKVIKNGLESWVSLDSHLEHEWMRLLECANEPVVRNDEELSTGEIGICLPDFWLERQGAFLETKCPRDKKRINFMKKRYAMAACEENATILFTPYSIDKFHGRYFKGITLIHPSNVEGTDVMLAPAICKKCGRLFFSYGLEDEGLCVNKDCSLLPKGTPVPSLDLLILQARNKAASKENKEASIQRMGDKLRVINGGK